MFIREEYIRPPEIEKLINDISKSDNSLAAWKSANEIYKVQSLESFDLKINSLKLAKKSITDVESKLNRLNSDKSSLTTKLKQSNESKANLEKLDKYYLSNALNIGELQTEKINLENRIRINQEIAIKIKGINRSLIESYKNHTISDAKSLLEVQLDALDTQQINNAKLIDNIRNHQNEISILLEQIQVYGEKLVYSEPNLSDCPLCGTDLKPDNLSTKINRKVNLEGKGNVLTDLLEISSQIVLAKAEIEQRLNTLESIKNITVSIKETGSNAVIEDIFIKFDEISNQSSNLIAQLKALNEQMQNYENLGLKVTELDKIVNALGFKGVFDLPEKLDKLIELNLRNREQIDNNIFATNAAIELAQNEIDQIKNNNYPLDRFTETSDISDLIENLSNLYQEVLDINRYMVLDKKASLSKVTSSLSQLKQILSSYIDNESAKTTLKKLEHLINLTKETSVATTAQLKQAEIGLKCLNKIVSDQSPETYLNEFLGIYTQAISDIFIQLHAPRDFQAVVLTDIGLKLKKTDDQYVGLSELSTGQRTALVISVFLAMNKSMQSAPQIIIFDDPITYVDDLNTLTFLDYLIKMVLKDKKQIFFATANQKLSSLFMKKFEFLLKEPNGFREIYLSRIEKVESNILYA